MATSKKKDADTAAEDSAGFTAEEKAAVKQAAEERRRTAAGKNTEQDVLDAIAAMTGTDKQVAEGLHALVKKIAPELTCRTWYGFPAYARDAKGKEIVFFYQMASKFKTRYGTLGFNDSAQLDDGDVWPVAYAITSWDATTEKAVTELIRRALG